MPATGFTRRAFLGALPATSLMFSAGRRVRAANDRPGILLVGCGGMGLHNLTLAARFGDVVALCDVDAARLARAAERHPGARRVKDYREAVALPSVDVVINATPDHWHTFVNLAALRAGRDVYSEKPLTFTIDEGRRLVAAVRKSGRILQTGSQQRSDRRFRQAVELVRNGRIGRLRHIVTSLPSGRHGGPFAPAPVPEGFDWDFWQGQTPAVEYVPERAHGSFRYWWDYGAGTLTDWGAHHNDIALWGLGLPADRNGPVSVRAESLLGPIPGGFTFPANYRVEYAYANGVTHTCRTVTTEGPGGNVLAEPPPAGQMPNGVRFEGTDGWIFVSRLRIDASDPDLLAEPLPAGAVRLPPVDDHMGNFFECVRTRRAPVCDVVTGHRSASLCHLGAIALRLGRTLRWDPRREAFPDDREAQSWTARPQRAGYTYADVA